MKHTIRHTILFVSALLGFTVCASAQVVAPAETIEKSPAKNTTLSLEKTTAISAGDPVAVQGQIAKSDTSPAELAPIVISQELQLTMPSGEIGALVFWDSKKIENETELLEKLKELNMPARLATSSEESVLNKKFGKDILYSVAKRLNVGEGDPSTAFALKRNVAAVIMPVPKKIASTNIAPTPAAATGQAGGG